jgi:protein-glucosylgalactosylhydroxylysine glucosidase
MLFEISIMNKNLVSLLSVLAVLFMNSCRSNSKIDRYALVSSCNIENSQIDSLNSLSVGNGKIRFTVDITGLQTFPEFYSHGNFLRTQTFWNGNNMSDYRLGLTGLQILKEDGKEISINDIRNPVQKLDLWTGEIESRFYIEGIPVCLKTVCHPDYDMISVKIISELIGKKRLKIKINFSEEAFSLSGYNSNYPDEPVSGILPDTNNLTFFRSSLNNSEYNVILWLNNDELQKINKTLYYLDPDRADSVYSFSCQYLNNPENGRIQTFGETETASRKSWAKFWTTGGAADFSESMNPRKIELERHEILSRYLSKIHFSRSLPQFSPR